MEIINLANSIRKELYESQKLKPISHTLTGLAWGLDVGLTLLEQSNGPFDGLTQNKADEIRQYFLNESQKHRSDDIEISIWYFSFAQALEQLFFRKDEV